MIVCKLYNVTRNTIFSWVITVYWPNDKHIPAGHRILQHGLIRADKILLDLPLN